MPKYFLNKMSQRNTSDKITGNFTEKQRGATR